MIILGIIAYIVFGLFMEDCVLDDLDAPLIPLLWLPYVLCAIVGMIAAIFSTLVMFAVEIAKRMIGELGGKNDERTS